MGLPARDPNLASPNHPEVPVGVDPGGSDRRGSARGGSGV